MCVWAYIAQVRIAELQHNFQEQVSIRYHFLRIFGDVQGKMRSQWAERGGLAAYAEHVQEVAAGFDHVSLNPDVWLKNTPASSLPAHLVLCAARTLVENKPDHYSHDLVAKLLGELRSAFFTDVIDIANQSHLIAIAERAGAPIADLQRMLSSGAAHAALTADLAAAVENGVKASPTLIFNEGRQILAGNVGYRVVEANVRELLKAPHEQQSWC
jgi:predicted DsbA family dithiol-disulfide isomerase